MLLQMFRTMLGDNTELPENKIDELVDTFMNTLPTLLKMQLQAASQRILMKSACVAAFT